MIRFYGDGDDQVRIEGPAIGRNIRRDLFESQLLERRYGPGEKWKPTDEVYVYGNEQEHEAFIPGTGIAASFTIGGQLIVHTILDYDMNWSFAVASQGEFSNGAELPNWGVQLKKSPYSRNSMMLLVDAPEGIPVRRLGDKMEGSKPDVGAGTYKVTCIPAPEGHTFEGVTEFVWECNHRNHAVNKANKRQLDVISIEKIDED